MSIDLAPYQNGANYQSVGCYYGSAREDSACSEMIQNGTAGAITETYNGVTTTVGQELNGGGIGPYANQVWYGDDADFRQGGRLNMEGENTLLDHSVFATELTHPFDTGQYSFQAFTYGYIQDQVPSVYVTRGQVADIKINLIIGVNITLDILFKKEHVITPTAMNMTGRVRLFDDSGNLVADWMTSEGVYVLSAANGGLHRAAAADGTLVPSLTGGPFDAQLGVSGDPFLNQIYQGYNYLPWNVSLLHVNMAGRSQVWNPWEGDYRCDPVFGCSDQSSYANGGWGLNTGILGGADYQGGWTAEVDFVPVYGFNSTGPAYYPPVNGLLMGESYHIIPGTTAKSGISYTEDGAQALLMHSMAPNHLGPYSQEGTWQISNAHNSGEASGVFEVDLNGFVSGNALAFNWANEFVTTSWYAVTVAPASGTGGPWTFYTADGMYQAFLTPGTYSFTIAGPGLTSQTLSLAVSSGQTGTGANVYLQQSGIPVPEFSSLALVAFSALAASLYVLRRRRK